MNKISSGIDLFLMQVSAFLKSGSRESRDQLLSLSYQIPIGDFPQPVMELFQELRSFQNNPKYNPKIYRCARNALKSLETK